jgi:hypothetical protein
MVSPDPHEQAFSSSYSRQNPIPRLLPKPPAHPGRWLFFCVSFVRQRALIEYNGFKKILVGHYAHQ